MRYRIRDNRKGLVLVAVLWVVMLLLIIIAGVGRASRLETKVCTSQVQQLRCKWACAGAVEFAAARLVEEQPLTANTAEQLLQVNANNKIDLEGCSVVFNVTDESGKLNINTATKGQLMSLYNMTEDIADAIVDWRDGDDEPGQYGAEAGYYANLPYPYMIRNDRFRTVRELLMVKGVTEKLLYGDNYQPIDDLSADKLAAFSAQQSRPWMYDMTCYSTSRNQDADGNRRININRDDENRMQSDLNIKQGQAKWIVDNRSYNSIADLLKGGNSQSSQGQNRNQNQNSRQGQDQNSGQGQNRNQNQQQNSGQQNNQNRSGNQNNQESTGQRNSNQNQNQGQNQNSNRSQNQNDQGRNQNGGQNQNQGQNRNQNNQNQNSGQGQNQVKAQAIDQATFESIADKITVNNSRRIEGLININTASKNVLIALLGGDERASQLADNVISYRQAQQNGFQSIADLLKVTNFKVEDLAKIAESITTRSTVFMINCVATSADNKVKISAETILDTNYDPYRLLYRYKGITN